VPCGGCSAISTGVAIVCARDAQGKPVGLTINSFVPVSLQPPLVLWNLALHAQSLSTFQRATRFAISVLAADQEALARRFADPQVRNRFGLALLDDDEDAPRIAGAVAHLTCTRHAVAGGRSPAAGRPHHRGARERRRAAAVPSRPLPARPGRTAGGGARMNIEALECMLAAGKDGALLRFGLGKGWLDAGNPVRAATHLGRCVVLDPQYSAAWKLLGKAWLASGQPQANAKHGNAA
jgi:hypothetical protein